MENERRIAQQQLTELIENGDIWMTREMPVDIKETERLPWDADYYEVKFLSAEERPNKYYHDKPYRDEKSGEQKEADNPILENNWNFKFEVVKGEKKGDWLFVNFVSKYWRMKQDGTLVGKLPKIALALNPNIDLKQGIDIPADLEGHFCRVSVEPVQDGKYANVTAWANTRLTKEEQTEAALGATEVDAGHSKEEIPF